VLADAFTSSETAANPIRIVDPPAGESETPARERDLTSEEMQEIRDRLKRIGYLG
jgi:hypothetical protein